VIKIKMRWAGHVTPNGEKINANRILVGKPEGKRPLGRYRNRWEDNIKRDLKEIYETTYTGFIWLRIGKSEQVNKPSGSKKRKQ
jgi:hypothetical protein